MIRKFKLSVVLLALTGFAFAASSPVTLLENTSNNVISELKTQNVNLQKNPKLVHSIVNKILLPHVDTRGMARSVLGRNAWKSSTKDQRKRFTDEFIKLVVRTYSGALAAYSDEKIEFYPIRGGYAGKKRVQVQSLVHRQEGPALPMSYRLVNKNDTWKVYDMSVEGVSILQSFRSQFATELSMGSIDDLIIKLRKRNKGSN